MTISAFPRLAGLVAVLATSPLPAAPPLAPTAKWNVDFGDAHCVATRDYGTKAAPLVLAFKPAPIGDVVQMSVVRPGSNKEIGQYPGLMSVGTAGPVAISVLGYPGKSGKLRVSSINLPAELYRPVRGATTVRLQQGGAMNYSFALSDMDAVTRALDVCVAGLRKLWNIDEPAITRPARATKPLISYFSADDYPDIAYQASDTGTVAMVALIDEAGKVASCQVTATSGYASFDSQSCAVISERAQFVPALGADGKPAKTGTTLRIHWEL